VKARKLALAFAAIGLFLLTASSHAANGTWTNVNGGSWASSANWNGGTIASGSDSTANFSTLTLGAMQTVTLDGARTIGNLAFGDVGNTYGWTLNTGSAGPLTLAVSSGSPTITVNGQASTIGLVLAGTNGMTKTGASTLTLIATNIYTGNTTISSGTLVLADSIAQSMEIIVAGTNAALQLTHNGSLTNAVLLAVNAGGTVGLSNGVNQTVGGLSLGGQLAGNGTWGSTASGAANQNNTYFSGTGIITVAVPVLTPSFIISLLSHNYGVNCEGYVNSFPGVVDYAPWPGADYLPLDSTNLNTYLYQYTNGWPVAVYFEDYNNQGISTAPVNNTKMLGSYWRSNSVMDTVTYFTTNSSPAMPLNYVFSDFEPGPGYAGSQALCDSETTNMLALVRASTNANVKNAFVGNYADYPGTVDVSGANRSARDTFYRTSGLNLAQPNAYPYPQFTNSPLYGPNARAGLLYGPLERVSAVKRVLPVGHRLVPWLNPTIDGPPVPTKGDNTALIAHIRLRGCDGFADLQGFLEYQKDFYGWTDLDWLFHALGVSQIENTNTSVADGAQWSGYCKGGNLAAFMFSNLGNSAHIYTLPTDFPGLPVSTPAIPAGTHTAWYWVNDPSSIATNTIYLGRDGISHGLYVNGNFALANAIVVANPGPSNATVTIGAYFTNNYSTTFSGPLTLNNNVTLQGYAQNLTFAGAISGTGGVTNIGSGNIIFTAANSYSGGTMLFTGVTLIVNGSLGTNAVTVQTTSTLGGSGTINGPTTVQAGGTIQGGDANGANTLTVANTLTLGDGAIAVTSSNFKIAAGGTISATKLNVTNINIVNILDASGSLVVGTNTLISYGGGAIGGSGFAGFQLGTLPAGVTAQLLNTGSAVKLAVTSVVATNPTNMTAGVSGTNLSLSWPSDHTGWRLLTQTNNLAAGISSNTNDWSPVPGSSTTNQLSLPIDGTMPMEFYRLVYP
jgi:autotransporter-associated beta strand protein